MSNPFMPKNMPGPVGNMQNLMQQFQQQFAQFRQSVQGNPQEIIQQKLQAGQISQSQVDSAFQMARSMGLIR